jgi:hypothetical protein
MSCCQLTDIEPLHQLLSGLRLILQTVCCNLESLRSRVNLICHRNVLVAFMTHAHALHLRCGHVAGGSASRLQLCLQRSLDLVERAPTCSRISAASLPQSADRLRSLSVESVR